MKERKDFFQRFKSELDGGKTVVRAKDGLGTWDWDVVGVSSCSPPQNHQIFLENGTELFEKKGSYSKQVISFIQQAQQNYKGDMGSDYP